MLISQIAYVPRPRWKSVFSSSPKKPALRPTSLCQAANTTNCSGKLSKLNHWQAAVGRLAE
jgi:hypothetical protein